MTYNIDFHASWYIHTPEKLDPQTRYIEHLISSVECYLPPLEFKVIDDKFFTKNLDQSKTKVSKKSDRLEYIKRASVKLNKKLKENFMQNDTIKIQLTTKSRNFYEKLAKKREMTLENLIVNLLETKVNDFYERLESKLMDEIDF
jgi:hypothetical protein